MILRLLLCVPLFIIPVRIVQDIMKVVKDRGVGNAVIDRISLTVMIVVIGVEIGGPGLVDLAVMSVDGGVGIEVIQRIEGTMIVTGHDPLLDLLQSL